MAGVAHAGDLAAALEPERHAELHVIPPPLVVVVGVLLGGRIEPSDPQRSHHLLRMASKVRPVVIAAEAERFVLLEALAQRLAGWNRNALLRLRQAGRQRLGLEPEQLVVLARAEMNGLALLHVLAAAAA